MTKISYCGVRTLGEICVVYNTVVDKFYCCLIIIMIFTNTIQEIKALFLMKAFIVQLDTCLLTVVVKDGRQGNYTNGDIVSYYIIIKENLLVISSQTLTIINKYAPIHICNTLANTNNIIVSPIY